MSVLKSVGKWVNKTWAQEASSNQILEPFSTLLKLAIISYKSDGTKIAIYKNNLKKLKSIVNSQIIYSRTWNYTGNFTLRLWKQ